MLSIMCKRTFVGATIAAVALCAVACMSPDVYREDTPIILSRDNTPASPNWTSELVKKPWTEGKSGWDEKKQAPSTGYTADQKYMILLRKPKPETWRHERDLVSEMIWAREKSRNK